ncbi:MAG: hypothetical protein J3K34DRAFT_193537 [Monoraphidium minutum]|nr:MAG: hypothetical protein J3K34DRAFT_193537 [Monoraphidium minutum]
MGAPRRAGPPSRAGLCLGLTAILLVCISPAAAKRRAARDYELAPLLAADGAAAARAAAAAASGAGAADALTDADLAAGAPAGAALPVPFQEPPGKGGLMGGKRRAGDPIPGRFIVTFAPNATANLALASIHKRVRSVADAAARKAARAAKRGGRALAQAEGGGGAAASDLASFQVERILGEADGDAAQPAAAEGAGGAPPAPHAVHIASVGATLPMPTPLTNRGGTSTATAAGGGPKRAGAFGGPKRRAPRAAVLVVSPELEGRSVMRAMGAAPGVASVVQDSIISVAVAGPIPGAALCGVARARARARRGRDPLRALLRLSGHAHGVRSQPC